MMSIRSETDQGQSLETGSGNDTDLAAGRGNVGRCFKFKNFMK